MSSGIGKGVDGRNRPVVRPTIPEPYEDVKSLRASLMATKEAVEMLNGQRGSTDDVAVTWGDLLRLGLIAKEQVPKGVK